MANIMDVANCVAPDSVFNVGLPPCDLAKKKIKGIIFFDAGVVFTPADCASVASFLAALKTKTTAARGARAYPIWDILNFEDSTGDPNTGSIGNLSTATIITQDAVPAFRFGYNGTEARHKRIAAMIGASLQCVFVDEQFAVYGTASGVNLAGYSVLQAYAYTSKFIVSDSVNQYSFRVTLGSISEYRDASRYVVTNAGILAAIGLVDIVLSALSNATNVWKIKMIIDGGLDAGPLYGSTLAGLTWTATNLETGAVFVVTSTAYDGALAAMTVTLDTTAWGLLTVGNRVQINGPTAAAMAAAGVKPFEMLPVVVVK